MTVQDGRRRCHLFYALFWVLLPFLLPLLIVTPVHSADTSPYHGDLSSPNESVVFHESHPDGKYVEIAQGSTLELHCVHGTTHTWQMPDNDGLKYFDNADYKRRVTSRPTDDTFVIALLITNAKETDTGLYRCIDEHKVTVQEIYVFVKGKSYFLRTVADVISNPLSVSGLVVPCRGAWMPSDVEHVTLNVGDKRLKGASQEYDPRQGFVLIDSMLRNVPSEATTFDCMFDDGENAADQVSYFYKPMHIGDGGSSNTRPTTSFKATSDWPYVGPSYNLTCLLEKPSFLDSFYYSLSVECPRCNDTKAGIIVGSGKAARGGGPSITISIFNLTLEDSGKYICHWVDEREKDKPGYLETFIHVSQTKEQARVIDRSPSEMTVDDHKTKEVVLFATVQTFPNHKSAYVSKWRKTTQSAQKGELSNSVIPDGDSSSRYAVESEDLGNGTYKEKLIMRNLRLNMSGRYFLSIQLSNIIVATVEFDLNVTSKTMEPVIELSSNDKWTIASQDFYKTGAEVHITCLVKANPPALIEFLRKSKSDKDFEPVRDAEPISGTFESGFVVKTKLLDNVEYKCEGHRQDAQPREKTTKKMFRVSEMAPEANIAVTKPSTAEENESLELYYEGDDLQFECIAPMRDDWNYVWVFKEAKLVTHRSETIGHTRHTFASVHNVSAANTGKYVCQVEHSNETILERTIEVIKTSKPYHTQTETQREVAFRYGETGSLTCNIDGTPPPVYRWIKDGKALKMEGMNDSTTVLKFPRVSREDDGAYQCVVTNRAGVAKSDYVVAVKNAPQSLTGIKLFLLLLLMLLMAVCLLFVFIVYLKTRRKNKQQVQALNALYEQFMRAQIDIDTPLPISKVVSLEQRVYQIPYDKRFEVERDNLEIGSRLGAGQFGVVSSGWLRKRARVSDAAADRGKKLAVAVKEPLVGTNVEHQKMLTAELKTLSVLGRHPNILALVGAVTKHMTRGQLYVIVEMCENGDLKTYLKKFKSGGFIDELREVTLAGNDEDGYLHPTNLRSKYAHELDASYRNDVPPPPRDGEQDQLLPHGTIATSNLISFAMQIANGMNYLGSIPVIHRDLAARNILLTGNGIIKIADFGMAKNEDLYTVKKSRNIPVPYRWMSIEAIEHSIFTPESDVWAFGIVLYEIFTLAGHPYPTIPNEQLFQKLREGERNRRPEYCHEEVYALMLRCWDYDPKLRPTFAQCEALLTEHLKLANPYFADNVKNDLRKAEENISSYDEWRGNPETPTNRRRQQNNNGSAGAGAGAGASRGCRAESVQMEDRNPYVHT